MKYITLDQFKEAGEDVVRKIMKWWVPSKGDLATSIDNIGISCVDYTDSKKIYFIAAPGVTIWEWNTRVVPLLTEGQLIEFIEHCTGWPVTISNLGGDYVVDPMPEDEAEFYSKKEHNADAPKWWLEEKCFWEYELIDALWKCAKEVSK